MYGDAELQKKMGSHGVKESGPDKESNTRDIVIKILSKVSTKIALKLPDVVDSVHRLGQRRGDGRLRVIIIQFAMRLYRDTVWRDATDNHYLKENPMGRLCYFYSRIQSLSRCHNFLQQIQRQYFGNYSFR